MSPLNVAGVPALTLPCGFDRQGLPVGLQLVGPAWAEPTLLRVAHAFQQASDWHTRRALSFC
jgi:Asp-tRNA(Asn)/Glu-tRNA(Gln) amidotransferase A subunit family amidase